jgi:hypothetical protein
MTSASKKSPHEKNHMNIPKYIVLNVYKSVVPLGTHALNLGCTSQLSVQENVDTTCYCLYAPTHFNEVSAIVTGVRINGAFHGPWMPIKGQGRVGPSFCLGRALLIQGHTIDRIGCIEERGKGKEGERVEVYRCWDVDSSGIEEDFPPPENRTMQQQPTKY